MKIRASLNERLKDFYIVLDDVSITELAFGQEFSRAIEEKQIAMQEAERAKYIVEQAEQDKLSEIARAQGEAQAIINFGEANAQTTAFLEMQRIEAAKKIASIMGKSRNRVYLEADTLLLNLTGGVDAHLEKKK